jgi:hypothetical protein
MIRAATVGHKPIVFKPLRREGTTISCPDRNLLFVLPVDGDWSPTVGSVPDCILSSSPGEGDHLQN